MNNDNQRENIFDDNEICNAELNRYRNMTKLTIKYDLLQWWEEHKHKFPIFYILAMIFLYISETSAPSERVCSIVSRIVTKYRARIDSHFVSGLIFLKDNGDILKKHYSSIEGRYRIIPSVYEANVKNLVDAVEFMRLHKIDN